MKVLRDSYDRHFTYLRLSLTEKCNFKCTYCLPNGYQSNSCASDLDLHEIKNLLLAFKKLGFTKLRLTGGEPTLRKDIIEIVELAKNLGFATIALTTNGFRLLNLLEPLQRAGLMMLWLKLRTSTETETKSRSQKLYQKAKMSESKDDCFTFHSETSCNLNI